MPASSTWPPNGLLDDTKGLGVPAHITTIAIVLTAIAIGADWASHQQKSAAS